MREAWLLFGLFLSQFVLGGVLPDGLRELERIGVGVVYLVLAVVMFCSSARYLRPLVRDGLSHRSPSWSGARDAATEARSCREPHPSALDDGTAGRLARGDPRRAARAGVLIRHDRIGAILDHNVDSTSTTRVGVYPLFVMILFGYVLAGWLAARLAPDGAPENGALAGLGAFVLWIPVRILIWVIRDDNRGLFSGHSPVFRPGQLFGQLVIAAALGMFGGFLGVAASSRPTRRDGRTTRRRLYGGSESAGRPRARAVVGRTGAEERPDSTGHGAG